MLGIDEASLALVDDLQRRYIEALDRRAMEAWLDCFSQDADASYFCIAAENVEGGQEIALMYDDCRARLTDRVTFITKVWTGTFQPYRMRHFVQRIGIPTLDHGKLCVVSNFHIAITPEGGSSNLLAVGQYEDTVVLDRGEPRFLRKRAVYDTTVLPRYIVYPF
ncbi:aromatic-ring-hydroxylating dioxygenase subunit beta [Polycyclovorans algicola]|jgi:3-phenylpropionate/cinnamic acid dioxygenase small subunit|uniref:aromatic-ring-hydroxylating dioxygenase subunit beta n=1 Tax=Polycyclovorans algicola TaxID=616992 RepID=UPI0004A6ED09|nr:aromatic-ring-hydroxylating dioxygenase subunit beta [Polycyclovorans algicola]